MTLPDGLQPVFVWTGRSASTGGFLERLGARREEEPRIVDPALEERAAVSSEGVADLEIGKIESFLEGVDAFWGALERLGGAIEAPILSEEHRILHRIAVDCGVRYKPSGAGGGDFGIAFTTQATAAVAFAERVTAGGFCTFDLGIDPVGVQERRA
jgi:phosphomevalonate kinase